MASNNKLCATILIFSILLFATFSNACNSCNPKPKPKPKPTPKPTPKPCPTPTPAPAKAQCPKDTLKLGACVDLLGLVNISLGTPTSSKCCALLEGLTDLEAALCLCTAIKANVLGINLNVPITLSLIISACQKSVPPGYVCE